MKNVVFEITMNKGQRDPVMKIQISNSFQNITRLLWRGGNDHCLLEFVALDSRVNIEFVKVMVLVHV
jgi:hypothetical protein